MRKTDELTEPESCMNKALDTEMVFVLLARDVAAPVAIRAWIEERIRTGKNGPIDPQMLNAEYFAKIMEREQEVTASRVQRAGKTEIARLTAQNAILLKCVACVGSQMNWSPEWNKLLREAGLE